MMLPTDQKEIKLSRATMRKAVFAGAIAAVTILAAKPAQASLHLQ